MGRDRPVRCEECGKLLEPGQTACYRCENEPRKQLEQTRRINQAAGWGWVVLGVSFLFLATRLANPMPLVAIGVGVVELALGYYFLRRASRFY